MFESVWDEAVKRVAQKLDVPADDVNDLLAAVTAADDLEGAHADGLCEYEHENRPGKDDTWESLHPSDRPALFCR